ncbi:phage antirepressor KilAC domain-containing protein [Clostridium sp. HBUAS56010]|uniref:phage antirepressor KilAC domain-containing protein n=1 Tax=Clostridium sp. HBUAS56010 TaxID=2571127 RepID=UPI0011787336|nr:phage antirepressor KilAC domain-containing protein [Clostridium sp. HBUAS56010]
MKNDLVAKSVDFLGNEIMCVKDESTEKIYVGVRWICNGIGFARGQINNEVIRVQNDIVLKSGCMKFRAGVFDENNETISIELDYLPLWLAKISITPKMQAENPELTLRLVNYQLKAKDVLAQAFIKPKEINLDNFNIPTTLSEALLLSANLAKENEEMKPKAEQFDLYLDSDGTISFNESAKALKTGRNRLMAFLRNKGILNQDNSPSQYCLDRKYFEVKTYTYVVKGGNKYQLAITRITSKGQDYMYRFLTKYIDEYCGYDPDYKSRIGEVRK